MQFIRHSRRIAVLLPLALACLAASPAWALRTQEANVVPVVKLSSSTLPENTPRQVRSDMLLATDGNIYFGSVAGGNGTGAVGKLTPAGELSTLYAFKDDGTEGVSIFGRLTQASDGHLYGTTFYGGGEQGGGTVFRVTLDGTFTLLHEFGGGDPNPLFPYTGVVQGPDGYLYGTTHVGGNSNRGTVWRIATDGTNFSVIHHFNGSNGENPQGTLIVGSDGQLYGTTLVGGANNRGTIYRISTAGSHEVVYSFQRIGGISSVNAIGANPRAGLMLSALDGNYYGTAYQGGEFGHGTVFRMTPSGQVSVLHAFEGPLHGGRRPLAGVVQDASGNLYGTTQEGGSINGGSAWRLAPDGTFTLLHGFTGEPGDGHSPYASLLLAHGHIYAVSYANQNASFSGGTIVKLDLGSGGVPPVELSVSSAQITLGNPVTVSWNAPAGSTCTKINGSSGWTGDAGVAGSEQLIPFADLVFGLSCLEADDGVESTPRIEHLAYASVGVNAPLLEPVDGGGGAGALSLSWLLLAALLLTVKVFKESRFQCP